MVLLLVLCAGALAADSQIERGVASGVLYVGVIALTTMLPGRRVTLAAAVLATVLTVTGFFLSPEAGELWKAGANRLLALLAVWVTAALVLHHKRLTARLEQVARRLQRSERQFGAAFESIPVALLLLAGDGRIVLVNMATARLFGYTRNEMRGQDITMLVPAAAELASARGAGLNQATGAALGVNGSYEATGIDKRGRTLTLDLGLSRVDTPDGDLVLATVVDRVDRLLVSQLRGAQATSRRMFEAEEGQRKRIAREVHDALGQPLTALKLDLGWLARRLAPGQPALHRRAIEMEALAASTIDEVRRLSAELRPSLLDDQGLAAALRWQVDDFEKRTRIRCMLALQDDVDWDAERRTVAFRVLQESLTNVARHAGASRVGVTLRRNAQGEGVLEIADDGCGIDATAAGRPRAPGLGLGLLGMRERAALQNGSLQISGQPGSGTTVSLCMPCEPGGGV